MWGGGGSALGQGVMRMSCHYALLRVDLICILHLPRVTCPAEHWQHWHRGQVRAPSNKRDVPITASLQTSGATRSRSVADRISGGGGSRVREGAWLLSRGWDQILNRHDVKGERLISVHSFGFNLCHDEKGMALEE